MHLMRLSVAQNGCWGESAELLEGKVVREGRGVCYIAETQENAMSSAEKAKPVYRFGPYVADVRAGELYKRGKKSKVQQQPMQVLAALLDKAGEVVTREELRAGIWPADTFVDFEHSLNTAIKKLRKALGDDAIRPKYIETLPRRGYRFLGEVEAAEEAPRTA